MSEDCLYLNVWTPATASTEDLPVMVWFHGGGNHAGWSYEKEFDGEGIASRGVILVTVDFRLGIFGFMAHPDLSAEASYGASGNYALLDQVASLQWVEDNIAAFGGDPDNVTVFGQSAGAMNITTLICSDLAEGLIDKVIFQSGGMIGTSTPRAQMESVRTNFANSLGMSIAELRGLSAEELYGAYTSFRVTGGSFDTCVDGYVVSDSTSTLVNQGKYLDIPYMIGSNSNDLGMPALFAMGTYTLGETQLAYGRTPIYGYLFDRNMPGGGSVFTTGAFHSAELWYVFETLDRCWRPFIDADYVLANQMAAYWTNFAKTGNPNGEGFPVWEPYTAANRNVEILNITE